MTDQERESFFTLHLEEFQVLIARRKHKWRATSIMEWDDISSILLSHIFQQLHRYNVDKPLDRWVNRVISNQMMNILRDNVVKTAKPCSAATPYGSQCVFNTGCDGCAWTKSGKQDSSCQYYAAWLTKKKNKFAISVPLSIENHTDEYHSTQDDFVDIDAAKKVIDENIKRRLTKEEYRVYNYLYIKHLSMEETMKKLGFKKNDQKNYMRIRAMKLTIKETAKAIVSESLLIK